MVLFNYNYEPITATTSDGLQTTPIEQLPKDKEPVSIMESNLHSKVITPSEDSNEQAYAFAKGYQKTSKVGVYYDPKKDIYLTWDSKKQKMSKLNLEKKEIASLQNADSVPKITRDFGQGSDVGACVGVAILQNFARSDEGLEYLNSIVKKDKNDNYVVSFPNRKTITITKDIINRYEAVEGNDYAEAIIFALYNDAGNLDKKGNFKRGDETDPQYIALNEDGTFKRLTGLMPNVARGTDEDLQKIEEYQNLGRKLLMTVGFDEQVDAGTNHLVQTAHSYSIVGVDTKNEVVMLANPWYSTGKEVIKMPIKDFQKYNTGMSILEITRKNGEVAFAKPNIGHAPDEIVYDKTIHKEPTKADYDAYFERDKDKKEQDYIMIFLGVVAPEEAEYLMNKGSVTHSEMLENLPIYATIEKAGYTPMQLLREYVKTGKMPEFSDSLLQDNKAKIEGWLKDQREYVIADIQQNAGK